MIDISISAWVLLCIASVMVGLGKAGVPGMGNIAIALFATILPARDSVGVILLVLIAADIVAVLIYRRHADWAQLWRLLPAAAIGIILGFFLLDYFQDQEIRWVIAGILLLAVAQTFWKIFRDRAGHFPKPLPRHWAPPIGILAGFVTMIANAAGPIMQLYLLAMRLPKMVFIGTGAWYFLILNVFKVPFSMGQDMVNSSNAQLSLTLIPAAILGGLAGPHIVKRISQQWFERLVLLFVLVSAIMLLVRG